MTLGYTDGKTKIKIFLLIFGIISISTLTAFELRKVIGGPKITIDCFDGLKNTNKKDCYDIHSGEGIYKIIGKTKNVSSIFIGNRKIYIDTKGNFEESVTLYPGTNLLTIKSTDRFGKEVKKDISIYYNSKLSILK